MHMRMQFIEGKKKNVHYTNNQNAMVNYSLYRNDCNRDII